MLSLIVRLFLSPLAAAAESGFLELVRILLDAGALDDPDEDGTCLAALGVLQSGKAERVADASCCMTRHCIKMNSSKSCQELQVQPPVNVLDCCILSVEDACC